MCNVSIRKAFVRCRIKMIDQKLFFSIIFIALPKEIPKYRPELHPVRRREPLGYNVWLETIESAPNFTFLLRPRVIQVRQTCKLLCCLSGNPPPTVKWYKDREELSKYHYPMTHADGVVTMEIIDCKPEDSGKYRCVATNIHGKDETSCVVIVEGNLDLVFLKRCIKYVLLFYFPFMFITIKYSFVKNFFAGTGETEEQVKLAHDLLHSGGKEYSHYYIF